MYSILLISGDRYSPDTSHGWRNYEINGNVNDRILIIPELLKRTKVEAVVPDCMAKKIDDEILNNLSPGKESTR